MTALTHRLLAVLTALAIMAGCGYSLKPQRPIPPLAIGRIENRTLDPGLTARITGAMERAMLSDGIEVAGGSEWSVTGTVDELEVKGLAFRDQVPVLLSVKLKASFKITNRAGQFYDLSHRNLFTIAFASSEPLDTFTGRESAAIDRALEEMAAELAVSMRLVRYGE